VIRASGTRHSSIRFVAGELNPMPTRKAPFLGAARHAEDSIMVVYGLDAAAILRGDGSLWRVLPNLVAILSPMQN
jgi:hypothetical protein